MVIDTNFDIRYYDWVITLLILILPDDLDTRAITRRLRENGSLNAVLSTDGSKADEELLHMSRSWDIVGLIV